jgi:hypothetical protein
MLARFVNADKQLVLVEWLQTGLTFCDTPGCGVVDGFYGSKDNLAVLALPSPPSTIGAFLGPGIDNARF